MLLLTRCALDVAIGELVRRRSILVSDDEAKRPRGHALCVHIQELFTILVLYLINVSMYTPTTYEPPSLTLHVACSQVDPRHRHHLFCFRRAPFFSTFLSVPPISASCSSLCMCSTLEKKASLKLM